MQAYEIHSTVVVKGLPVPCRSIETADSREEACRQHGSTIAAALHPHKASGHGLITRIEPRQDLIDWARDKAKEALERARHDSRVRKISLTLNSHGDWQTARNFVCKGCNQVIPEGQWHTCNET